MSKYLIIPVYLLIATNIVSFAIGKITFAECTINAILVTVILICDVATQIKRNLDK